MRIILMCSNIHNYGEKIKRIIENRMGYEVLLISPELPKELKEETTIEKVFNKLIFKPFPWKNIREIEADVKNIRRIKSFGEVDFVLAIFASYHSKCVLRFLKRQGTTMICHFWDSFSFHPKQFEYLKYFRFISSFDPKEAKQFGMRFIPNFYFEEDIVPEQNPMYEVFTILKYDERFPQVEKIARFLQENQVRYLFIVVAKKEIESEYVEIRNETISLGEVYDFYSKSRSVLEIGHIAGDEKQGGLSFRAIEALGNRKKLITNYDFVREYDFYNSNNVFILDEKNVDGIWDFLCLPYKQPDDQIYRKYNSESWIREILSQVHERSHAERNVAHQQ